MTVLRDRSDWEFSDLPEARFTKQVRCRRCRSIQDIDFLLICRWEVFDIDCLSCGDCYPQTYSIDGADLYAWRDSIASTIEEQLSAVEEDQDEEDDGYSSP